MTPALSRRLGSALGTKTTTPAERATITDAAQSADTWSDLPADVKTLVGDVESRPDTWSGSPVAKADAHPAGDLRARHLIRWYEHGAGGIQIGWGTDGDFGRCVALATEHAGDQMSPAQVKGFCANRHHAVLGVWPGREHVRKGRHSTFDPAETRDEHGRWSEMGAVEHVVEHVVESVPAGAGGKRPKKSDRLKVAGRIKLDPGEELVNSAKISGDFGTIRMAEVHKDGRPSLILGIGNSAFGSRDSEAGPWSAGPDNTAAINAERAKLRDEQQRLDDRRDELQLKTVGEQTEHGYSRRSLNPADKAELAAIEARLGELEDESTLEIYADGHTAKLSADEAEQLHTALSEGLSTAVKAEAVADELQGEFDRLKEEQQPLIGMGRVWTDAEEARWDSLAAQMAEVNAKANAVGDSDDGYQVFADGVVRADWADIHYRIFLDDIDIGVEVRLGVVPHGSGVDLDGLDEEAATFEPPETRQLLRHLAALG